MTADALASGTVTFLFSDIEGSTRLEQAVGTARYAQLRERHREIMRSAFAAHGGVEQGTEGDSFFVVFNSAPEAVAASIEAQRALADEPWPDDASVRVRIGLHSGEAELAGGNLVGLDINRAARIAAAAHGEQIVVSDATRALVANRLPNGARLIDLGAVKLKDLPQAERLAQITCDGLRETFPPLQTADTYPSNLPTQLTTFVGRDNELNEAAGLLEGSRLLTLTGPGGTGKTRMSL
jgi:class 3 adenylate cyclase